MPKYDFRCSECGKTFERLVSISKRHSQECECGGEAKQLIAAPWQRIDINSDRWVNRHKNRR